jgi:hypothetical protein
MADCVWRRRIRWGDALRPCWPGFAALACLAVTVTLAATAADTRIPETGGMRLHTFWEPLYYELQTHPDWDRKYGAYHNHQTGDAVPQAAVDAYRAEHHLTEVMTLQGYENYLRIVYLNFLWNDPRFVVRLKYLDLIRVVAIDTAILKRFWREIDRRIFVLCLAVLICFEFVYCGVRVVLRDAGAYAAVLIFFALLSAVPIWATVVNNDLLADMLTMAMLASLAAGFSLLAGAGALLVSGARCAFTAASTSGRSGSRPAGTVGKD